MLPNAEYITKIKVRIEVEVTDPDTGVTETVKKAVTYPGLPQARGDAATFLRMTSTRTAPA